MVKLKKIIAVLVSISLILLQSSFSISADESYTTNSNQSGVIPVSGSSGLAQSNVDQLNFVIDSLYAINTSPGGTTTPAQQQIKDHFVSSGVNLFDALDPVKNPYTASENAALFFRPIVRLLGVMSTIMSTFKPVPPVLNGQGAEDNTGILIDLTNNDFVAMNRYTYQITRMPQYGSATLVKNVDGSVSVSYIPNSNFNGSDFLEYSAVTAFGVSSDPTRVNLAITPVNDVPSAQNLSIVFDHALGHQYVGPGPLGSLTDIDGDALQYTITKNLNPLIGNASIDPITKKLIINPGSQCVNGFYNIDYSVSDGTVVQTASIQVEMKNCPVIHPHPTLPADPGSTIKLHTDDVPNFADVAYAKKADGSARTIHDVTFTGKLSDFLASIGASNGKIPDDVLILRGDVLFDTDLDVHTLALYPGAHLRFATDKSTQLRVVHVLVTEGSHLEIGSALNPIQSGVRAEVVFKDQAIDLALDPQQYGNGLLGFGKVTMHGQAMNETFMRVSSEPRKNQTELKLESAVSGWSVGDKIAVPDTRQLFAGSHEYYNPSSFQWEEFTIVKIINGGKTLVLDKPFAYDHLGGINSDGIVEFYPHVMNLTRNIVLRSENLNGTRGHTLYTHTADVDIQYAQFLDLGRTKTGNRYSGFRMGDLDLNKMRNAVQDSRLSSAELRKVLNLPIGSNFSNLSEQQLVDAFNYLVDIGGLHSTIFNDYKNLPFSKEAQSFLDRAQGKALPPLNSDEIKRLNTILLSSIYSRESLINASSAEIALNSAKKTAATWTPGTNQIGRYAIHFHHLSGEVGGQANGYQYTLTGNSVVQSLALHNFKWGIAIHNSHYGLVNQNTVYNAMGAGIATEDGSETGNVIEKNMVLRVSGSGGRGDERMDPDASVGRTDADFGHDGVGFWFHGGNNIVRDNVAVNLFGFGADSHYGYKLFPYKLGNVKIPAFKGANTSHTGEFITVNSNAIPLMEFSNNEVYGAQSGLTYWWIGSNDYIPQATGESVIKDLKIWNVYNKGIFHYPAADITIDGMVMLLDPTKNAMGFDPGDYAGNNIIIRNSRIEGAAVGIFSVVRAGFSLLSQPGYQLYDNLILRNKTDISITNPWFVANDPVALAPLNVIIRDTQFKGIPGYSHRAISRALKQDDRQINQMIPVKVLVENYNDVQGMNFQVYALEQLADYVPQETLMKDEVGFKSNARIIASPEAGLTNAELMQKYGVAIGGEAAPCSDTLMEVRGLACGVNGTDLQDPAYSSYLDKNPYLIRPSSSLYKNSNGKLDVLVSWYTSDDSDSKVTYTVSGQTFKVQDNSLRKFHEIWLRDLDPGKSYVIDLESKNAAGFSSSTQKLVNGVMQHYFSGVLTSADTVAPNISTLYAAEFSQGAQIFWKTSDRASFVVEYGLTTAYGMSVSDAELDSQLETADELRWTTLKGLQPGVTYHYRVTLTDFSGNKTASADKTFNVPYVVSPAQGELVLGSTKDIQYVIPAAHAGASFAYRLNRAGGWITDSDKDGKAQITGLLNGDNIFETKLVLGGNTVSNTEYVINLISNQGLSPSTSLLDVLSFGRNRAVKTGQAFEFQYNPLAVTPGGHVHVCITTSIPTVDSLNSLPSVVMDMDADGKVNLTAPTTQGQYWLSVWPVDGSHSYANQGLISVPVLASDLATSLTTLP